MPQTHGSDPSKINSGGILCSPLSRGIKLFEIKAPRIAKKQRPGQFVIVRLDDMGERIPLTIADANPEAGTITIVVQAIGKTTMLLSML
jgi:NAD(P)H-flavin reductase